MKKIIFTVAAAATLSLSAQAQVAGSQAVSDSGFSRGYLQAKMLVAKQQEREASGRAFLLGTYLVRKNKTLTDTSTSVISAPTKKKQSIQKN